MTKIHFQFWQPSPQDHRPPPVLFWGLQVLEANNEENRVNTDILSQHLVVKPKDVKLTIVFIIAVEFRLFAPELSSALISSTSSPSASSSSAT